MEQGSVEGADCYRKQVHGMLEVLIKYPDNHGRFFVQDEFQKMSDELPLELTLQMGRYV